MTGPDSRVTSEPPPRPRSPWQQRGRPPPNLPGVRRSTSLLPLAGTLFF